ncbi:MAG TPA: caspase family protein [Streptosporangiaceae bacterium]|nr:caspase family protein [Streptosporangiaceae bacterium]
MANRRALLIGVPHYEDPELDDPRLGAAVTVDIAVMRAALEQSGYDITDCGIDKDRGEATPTRIRRAIKTACADASVGGVLLIYFSGHGVTISGQDYLVPTDAYRGDVRSDVESLVPVIPAESLAACRASLVVFFVDACRTDPAQEDLADPSLGEPGGQLPFLAGGGHFVLVMGCGADQVCQYDETGSAFTQSLAKVFDARNPARSLTEVVNEVTKDMARRSRQSQGDPQEPVVRYPEVLTLAGQIQVCDGDERAAAWRKAIEQSPLLSLCDHPDQVQAVVAECARRCGIAQDVLWTRTGLTDRWTDQDYPVRVLRRTEFLLRFSRLLPRESTDTMVLRPGETALLIAAPFLREAVLAVGIHDAAGINPANLDRTYTPGARGDLELTHEMHQHLVRRAVGLRERARTKSAELTATAEPTNTDSPVADAGTPEAMASDQLALWLVHQWIGGRAQLWEESGAQEVCRLGKPLLQGDQGAISDPESVKLVQAVLLAVGAEPADERLAGRLAAAYVSDRWRFVITVLWLAGSMAADLRRLPSVVPDLLGTGMELPFTDIQDAAGRRADWAAQDTGGVDLRLVCEHPALHDAFESIVERAANARHVIRRERLLPSDLESRLPLTFTATGLRAATKQDDEPAYAVPLSRFQIAEEKVRELLMGKQLYGEPNLAIRELYQNALDACRWRQTRQEYRSKKFGGPAHWTGLIRFTQGTDDGGRPYIECADNGVGMDLRTLKHVFANAGERFVYGQDFRAEQVAWSELDPPLRLISNSQFGVGVFSYFMLADEVTVTTRHQRRDGGVATEAYEVRIASSGSLIQIRQAPGELPDAGTRVRLYLGGDVTGVSVLRTLRDLLWVAEHRVEATSPEGNETWNPGELRRPQENPQPLRHGRDLWWVAGDGGIAADGIKTAEEFYGLVVNLRDERRPQFTVDRNTLRAWDEKWVREEVAHSLPTLVKWPGFTLTWLWKVAYDSPTVGQQIFDYSLTIGHHVNVGQAWGKSEVVSLDVAGCLSSDNLLFAQDGRIFARWFAAWRAGVWANLVNAPTNQERTVAASRTDGFPVPDSIDSDILDKLNYFHENEPPSAARITRALTHPERTVLSQLRRLRRYAITGLDVSGARRIPPIERIIKDDDDDDDDTLLPVVTAWSKSSGAAKINSAGPVLWASYYLSQPIGEVLRRVQNLVKQDSVVPIIESGELAHRPCTYDEARFLSRSFSMSQHDWIDGDLSPRHLVRASEEFGGTLGDVLTLCDQVAPLGVQVASRAAYPDDVELIELLALRYLSIPGQSLTPLHVIMIAGRAGISVGAAYEGLARLERNGLLVRPQITGPLEFAPARQDLSAIGSQMLLYSRGGRHEEYKESPWADLIDTILDKRSTDSQQQLARSLIKFISPAVGEIAWLHLIEIAFSNDKTVLEAAGAIREAYPGIPLPEIERDVGKLTVSWEVFMSLVGWRWRREWNFCPWTMVYTVLNSRQLLGDLLYELSKFRALGVPVPFCDESVRLELNQVTLDEYDLDMLIRFDEFGDPSYLRRIGPFQLLQIAARYGWTLAEAQQRFARLVPIGLELECSQADLPDEIVYWYDLLALTTYFDGQDPVASGRIDQAYLDRAAEEIFDVKPEEIPEKADLLRERLRIYAPLFQFELAPQEEDPVG